VRLDAWLLGFEPSVSQDLKLAGRVSASLTSVLERSYPGLKAENIDRTVVELSTALATQIHELHQKLQLERPLERDLIAVNLVMNRQVG
jgi:hypothetical protein